MDPVHSALLTAKRSRYEDGGAPEVKAPAPAPAVEVARAATSAAADKAPAISEADIQNLYKTTKGIEREADAAGLDYWKGQAANGMTLDQMQAAFNQAAKDPLAAAQSDTMKSTGAVASFGDNPPVPPTKPLYLQTFDYSKYDNPFDARYAYLSKTFNPTIAAAMMGNYAVESFNNPNQFQIKSNGTPLFDKNNMPTGYGAAQWGGTRLTNPDAGQNKMGLFDFADKFGFDPNSTEGQDRFSVYELTQNPEYAGAYKDLLSAGTNINKATQIFGEQYESPKNLGASLADRQAKAGLYQNYYSNPSSLSAADQAAIAKTKTGMFDPAFQKYAADKAAAEKATQLAKTQTQTVIDPMVDTVGVDTSVNDRIMQQSNDYLNQSLQNNLNNNFVDANNLNTGMGTYNTGMSFSSDNSGRGMGTGFGNDTGISIMNGMPDWYSPYAHGGAVGHALRLAHHYATGGHTPAQPNYEREIDRINRMLAEKAEVNPATQDWSARRNEYLQGRPGPQIRDRSFADGGAAESVLMQEMPSYDPMGNVTIGAGGGFGSAPGYGAVESASKGMGAAGAAIGEPLRKGAENYLGNMGQAFHESGEYARQGLENTVSDKGPLYNTSGPLQYGLGTIGQLASPLTGAAMSAGQAATQLTGNPNIGSRVEFVGGLVDPSHAGALKTAARAAHEVSPIAAAMSLIPKAADRTAIRIGERELPIRPSTDDLHEVMEASTTIGRAKPQTILPIEKLDGGVDLADPKQRARVDALKEKMMGEDGHISRIIVDQDGNVVEGQHRFEALRELGAKEVPVEQFEDLAANINMGKLGADLDAAQRMNGDQRNSLINHAFDALKEEGSVSAIRENYDPPKGYEKGWNAILDHLETNLGKTKTEPQMSVGPSSMEVAQEMANKAVQTYGTTHNIAEAGYVLPNGKMLDFSGRHQAGYDRVGDKFAPKQGERDWLANDRAVDHRDVVHMLAGPEGMEAHEGMAKFMAEAGAIRNKPGIGFETAAIPTDKQVKTIVTSHNTKYRGEPLVVELSRPTTGDIIASRDFERPNVEAIQKWFREQSEANPGVQLAPKFSRGGKAPRAFSPIPFGPEAAQRAVQIAKQQAGRR